MRPRTIYPFMGVGLKLFRDRSGRDRRGSVFDEVNVSGYVGGAQIS
jgi:hypothetical protein